MGLGLRVSLFHLREAVSNRDTPLRVRLCWDWLPLSPRGSF
jgi:hypothetical protein